MAYKYIPEPGRKKFKEGQTVWVTDHSVWGAEVKEAVFVRYKEREHDYLDSVLVRVPIPHSDGILVLVLEERTFTNREAAERKLRSLKRERIRELREEIKKLKS